VIEQNPVARKKLVALAVNSRHPVGVHLRHGIGAARFKERRFALRRLCRTEHLRARRLIEPRLAPGPANRFEQPHRAQPGDIAGVFRHIKTHAHVALRREVIKLIRCEAVNQVQHPLRAGKIAVMQKEPCARLIRILIDVIDALRVKRARASDDPVHFISFGQQQFREVRSVLPGNARDQCAFHERSFLSLAFPKSVEPRLNIIILRYLFIL
jgi:hypothetical protein